MVFSKVKGHNQLSHFIDWLQSLFIIIIIIYFHFYVVFVRPHTETDVLFEGGGGYTWLQGGRGGGTNQEDIKASEWHLEVLTGIDALFKLTPCGWRERRTWTCLMSGELTVVWEAPSWWTSVVVRSCNVAKSCKTGLVRLGGQTERFHPDDCTCMTFSCRLSQMSLTLLVHLISTKQFSKLPAGGVRMVFLKDSVLQLDSPELFPSSF